MTGHGRPLGPRGAGGLYVGGLFLGGSCTLLIAISPFQAKRKLYFLDQPASGARCSLIVKSDSVPVFFYRLERAYSRLLNPPFRDPFLGIGSMGMFNRPSR
jgi:hypothetical protein